MIQISTKTIKNGIKTTSWFGDEVYTTWQIWKFELIKHYSPYDEHWNRFGPKTNWEFKFSISWGDK